MSAQRSPTDVNDAATGETPTKRAETALRVVVVDSPEGLEPHVPAWEALAANALEPNPFFEPWFLLPAARHLAGDRILRFVFVYAGDPDPASPSGLWGFFPVEQRSRYLGLPVRTVTLWKHEYCFLCTPLLRRDRAREALDAFMDWLAAGREPCAVAEFGYVAGDGPFQQVLVDYLHDRARLSFQSARFTRGLFRTRSDSDAYLETVLSGKHRRAVRARERSLAALGRLEYTSPVSADDAESWVEGFLRLEASGWKGRRGSALASKGADRRFFETAARAGCRRGRVLMRALHLDGTSIGARMAFRAGSGAFTFKIAFDERYARFSPGFLLELDNIRQLCARNDIAWMDSCTEPDNVMFDRLCAERRTIETLLISTGRALGDLVVSSLPMARWANRLIRGARLGENSREARDR